MMNDVKQMTFNEKLAELKKWFSENPKLPDEIDDLVLRRFLRCVHGDTDEAKRVIEHHYTLRNKNPHIFIDRDPSDEAVREFLKIYDMVPLPGLTPEGHKIVIFRFNDKDPSKVNSVLESKTFHMVADCRFTMPDLEKPKKDENDEKNRTVKKDKNENENADENEEIIIIGESEDNAENAEIHLAEGDIQIMDMSSCTWSHLARVSFLTLRSQLKFVQEAYPMRLCGSHMINCPSFIDKMISFVRPFIKDEVFEMMHFHTNGIESLYEHVPREMLPTEYGGSAGTIEELKKSWLELIDEKKEYLTDPKYWKVENTQSGSRWGWW